ncbi:hypothetical protein BDN72DRAFT_362236 [Pluteus cervinus]|uniref:Uncharacterized protein n=1 Tax=Pluteus cervinus TaxID=181527 RepID=A0ACD3BCY0_9AGAR|nr:hypothetical protein BDN72DRAFT_362236 [Pluteus cervinus]
MSSSQPSAHPLFQRQDSASASASATAQRLLRSQIQERYAKQTWIFIGSVLAFLTVIRVIRLAWAKLSLSRSKREDRPEKSDIEKKAPSQVRRPISLRHLPDAFAAAFRIVFFRLTPSIGSLYVTTVTESVFTFSYIAAMLIWLYVDTQDLQSLFYQDRAAHLASVQLPLVVALAGKNSVITWLTGVSHEKLNVLHRAAARTCLLMLWTHAIARTVAGLPERFDFTHTWMRWGAVGLAAFSLATFLSIRPFRNLAFEFFLISHIILIAIFLISGYLHTRDPGYEYYIWPAMVVWGFDRLFRFVRMAWNNRSHNDRSSAQIELLTEDTIRITFRRRMTWTPGQHAYLTLPTISKIPTEAHPFSIANIPTPSDDNKDTDVVFLVKARGGFTRHLREHAARNGVCKVPAYLDGPYGCAPDLRMYSTVILLAGGSGVTYTLPLLLHLVRARGRKSLVRRIVFIWSVREAEHLQWISKVLTEALSSNPSGLVVEPRVYITGPEYSIPEVPALSRSADAESIEKGKGEKVEIVETELPTYSTLRLIHGRPSIRKVLHEEVMEAQGPVSVDVAGPGGLTHAVRRALRSGFAGPSSVLRGIPPVTLHVETFGMFTK